MKDSIVQRFKSKTYLAAITGTVLSIIELKAQVITSLLPPGIREYAILMWPALMLTLREFTNGAIEDK